MKAKLFLLGILITHAISSCSPHLTVPHRNFEELRYVKVIEVPGLKTADIMRRSNRWIVENYTSYNKVVHYQDSTYLAANAIVKIYNPYRQSSDVLAKIGERFAYQIIIEGKPGRARAIIHRFIDDETKDVTYSRAAEMADIDVSKFSKADKKRMKVIFGRKHKELESNAESIFESLRKSLLAPVENW